MTKFITCSRAVGVWIIGERIACEAVAKPAPRYRGLGSYCIKDLKVAASPGVIILSTAVMKVT